jgi:hypothetical protein
VIAVRKALAALAAIVLALLMSAPAASAPAGTSVPIHGTQLRAIWDARVMWPDCPLDEIAPPDTGTLMQIDDPTGCWFGPVHGDINGTIAFWETTMNYWVDDTEYYFEVFTFLPEGGGYINGVDEGVFYAWPPLWRFSANGWVTATSDGWADLRGAHFFESGRTTDINLWPITAYGTRISFTKASA